MKIWIERWRKAYFSFNSFTLAPTELSCSSSLFFLFSVFLRFLDTHAQTNIVKQLILCIITYLYKIKYQIVNQYKILKFLKITKIGNEIVFHPATAIFGLMSGCVVYYVYVVWCELCVFTKSTCMLDTWLCCSYSCSPACSLSSGSILSRTWEYWTLALTQAARGAAAALARFAFWPKQRDASHTSVIITTSAVASSFSKSNQYGVNDIIPPYI